MYGKSYESKYTGSMIGAGFHVFAVWDWIITNAHFGVVEINPKLLAFTLAGTRVEAEDEVLDAIGYLSRPDPKSRSKDEDGRRIVREGEFQYRVVNWEHYFRMKNADSLRQYNREAKQRERSKRKAAHRSAATLEERHYLDGVKNGTIDPATGSAIPDPMAPMNDELKGLT